MKNCKMSSNVGRVSSTFLSGCAAGGFYLGLQLRKARVITQIDCHAAWIGTPPITCDQGASRLLAVAAVLLTCLGAHPGAAQGVTLDARAAPGVASCPYKGWPGDGCKSATGGFLIASYAGAASFYDYAAQSGQHWAGGGHPWRWNSPGIDYGVGPDKTVELEDPAKATLPAGCAYEAVAPPGKGGIVRCGAPANDPVLAGLDLGLRGCIPVIVEVSVTGALTIVNSHLANGANCNEGMIRLADGAAGLILRGVLLNGDYTHFAGPEVVVGGNRQGPFVMVYSVSLDTGPLPISGELIGPHDVENSVSIGSDIVTTDPKGLAGQYCDWGCPADPRPYPLFIFRNNVTVISTTGRVIALPAQPLPAMSLGESFQGDHNIMVFNHTGGETLTYARHLEGEIAGNRLTLTSGKIGVIPFGADIVGLPGGDTAVVLATLGANEFAIAGVHPPGRFTGATVTLQSTMAALTRVAYEQSFQSVVVNENYFDLTGAYSCVKDFGATADAKLAMFNYNLVTGAGIKGFGRRGDADLCPLGK